MKQYHFPEINGGTTLTDPTIEVEQVILHKTSVKDMTIHIYILVSIENASPWGVYLTGVKVNNLTYTAESLQARLNEHLNEKYLLETT